MYSRIKPRRLVVVLGLLTLVVAGVSVVSSSSDAASKTKKLHGKMQNIHNTHSLTATPPAVFFGPSDPGCQSSSGVCSRFTATGDLKGDGLVFIDTFPSQDSPSYSKAHTTITTKKGVFTCHEAALFDLQGPDHAFVDECIIDGGTGVYAGTTGYIQEIGQFDFAINVGEADVTGLLVSAGG